MQDAQPLFGELASQGGPCPAEYRTTASFSPAGITNPGLPPMQD